MRTATKKADTAAIRAALDSGSTLEEAISAGFAETHAPPPGLAVEMGDPTDPMMQALAEVADTINHCPDYGECYFNAETGDVWWEACDGDPYPAQPGGGVDGEDVPAGTSFDDITSRFMAVDGVNTVTIEAENPPPDDGSYVQVPQADIASGGDAAALAQSPQAAPPQGQGEDPAQPHTFKPADGNPMQCAVCGQMSDADIHDVEMAHLEPGDASIDAPAIVLADGRRLLGLFAVAVDPDTGHTEVSDLRTQLAELAPVEEGDSPPEPADAPALPATGGSPFRSVLALEGTPTDDGRLIEEGALTWRELPLTLMAMIEEPEMGGHGGAQVAGRIDTITREGSQLIGTGSFDSGTFGAEIARLVNEKTLRGVSVDLAIKEYEERWGDEVEGGTTDPMMGESFLLVVKAAVIMGATVCPFPAFAGAGIEILASGKPAILHVDQDDDGVYTGLTVMGEFQPVDGPDVPTPPGGGSLMVALFPTTDQATTLADPDGNVPAEQLHVTLFAQVSGDADALTQLVDQFAGGYGTLSGIVGGAATFGSETPGQEGEPAETAPDADEGDEGGAGADADVPQVLVIDAPGLGELRFDLADALESAGITYATDHDFTPHITTDYDDPADMAHNMGLIGTAVSFGAISIVAEDGTRTDVPLSTGLTASAAGLVSDAPPSEWFDYPAEVPDDDIVPFTVTEDGRVFGHVALFNECHIGSPKGRCITAPHHYREGDDGRCVVCDARGSFGHSASGYDYFHLGQVETSDGELVNVGQITLGTGHAPVGSSMTPKAAAAHYDNTGTATCDVRCYENRMGIVVAGALRATAPATKVRELKAAKISGDWRSIRGHHELVGLLAVNIPGYPIPRSAARGIVNDGGGRPREIALVAAGIVPDEPTEELREHREHREQMREMLRRERLRLLLRSAR